MENDNLLVEDVISIEADETEESEAQELINDDVSSIEADETEESVAEELLYDTVSGGDSMMMFSETADYSEVVALLQEQIELLEASHETQSVSIWEKPISDYTVSESLLLVLVLIAVGSVVYNWLGGILKCTIK